MEAYITYFHREKHIKKTRKIHVCNACRKEIPIGSSADYVVGLNDLDDKIYQGYYHQGAIQGYECA